MKLIIQIPCYNEEKTLPITFNDLPKKLDNIDEIDYVIINDGSTDNTVEVAKKLGIKHIINIKKNQGLANAFKCGLKYAIEQNADIIVNTDADNQYCGADIEKLIKPIINGEADIVIGVRPINYIEHFSYLKKKLQQLGSWFVRIISKTNVIDATSGFRAYSRNAALQINIYTDFTYTLETIILAAKKKLIIKNVPISVNKKLRESRLFKSNFQYILKSVKTIIRLTLLYEPLKIYFF